MKDKPYKPKKLGKKINTKEADRIKKLNEARAKYPSAFDRHILISER